MLGKLGVVRAGSATLRVDRTANGRPLTIVSKGSNLAVVAEDTNHYGVLMVDNTIGWIPKAHVELIDFDVQITLPPPTADGSVSAPADEPTFEGGSGAGGETVLEGLAPRTESLLREAFSYLGVPYVWAGNTRRGIDCSGFVKNVFGKHGVNLPRHSGDQAGVGVSVNSVEDLQPGDRLYFDMKRSGRINHCGIYIGNGYFIHASSNQHKVGVDQISKKNYWNGLKFARRDL
jgi:cell wall-associated NlpC family hydrolase